MVVLNDLDRFHLVLKVIDRLLFPGARAATQRHYLTRGCPPASRSANPARTIRQSPTGPRGGED
jgi:hypothetical protein